MLDQLISMIRQGAVTPIDGVDAVAMPNDVRLVSTIHLKDDIVIRAGIITAESIDSLVDYVTRYDNESAAVFASATSSTITAIFDWHPKSFEEYSGLARHQVILPLQFSDQWKAWAGINGKMLQQRTLAEFIEEYLGDIVEPDAAAVLETVLTLSGKKSVNYKNATRLANGDVSLVWEEATEAKAGQSGDLKVPSELKLRLPVYAGCEAETTFEIRTMFRYHISDGTLTFQLKMLGIEHIRELAFEAVYESLGQKLKKQKITAPLYHGAVTKTPLEILTK